ncbi:SapC family protein [Pseudoalteromonas sp. B193]
MYSGLYAINEQALAQLDVRALKSLHEMGYLQACYMIIASTGHIQKLIGWLNETLLKQPNIYSGESSIDGLLN